MHKEIIKIGQTTKTVFHLKKKSKLWQLTTHKICLNIVYITNCLGGIRTAFFVLDNVSYKVEKLPCQLASLSQD